MSLRESLEEAKTFDENTWNLIDINSKPQHYSECLVIRSKTNISDWSKRLLESKGSHYEPAKKL